MTGTPGHFGELMLRVRQGDADAVRTVLAEYGDAIRREARFTLLDARLRRVVGESDVYQTVVMRFFAGMRDGNFQVQTPEDLVRLLRGIARNRIAELARFWRADRRNLQRTRGLNGAEQTALIAPGGDPLERVARSELAQHVDSRLSGRDRRILDWRDAGASWAEIAARLGSASADASRKRHERALARLAAGLPDMD